MSESSHVPSLLISPTHDGMLGNWRSHGFILHWSRDWIRTNDLLGMSQTSYQLRYSAMRGLTTRAANPQLWPAPSLNWPGRRLPFRRLSFLPYRTPRRLITTLCFEGNLGEFLPSVLGDEPSHPSLSDSLSTTNFRPTRLFFL